MHCIAVQSNKLHCTKLQYIAHKSAFYLWRQYQSRETQLTKLQQELHQSPQRSSDCSTSPVPPPSAPIPPTAFPIPPPSAPLTPPSAP